MLGKNAFLLISGLTGLLVVLAIGVSSAYTLSDCQQIYQQIQGIEHNKAEYSNLTMYSYYARLGDKYFQLGECYQDAGANCTSYFEKSGDYYQMAAKSYIAGFSKKYSYLMSAGDAYAQVGMREKALDMYRQAREILMNHPEINVDISVVNQKITNLLNNETIHKNVNKSNYAWVVGLLVLLGVIGGIYYIYKKY